MKTGGKLQENAVVKEMNSAKIQPKIELFFKKIKNVGKIFLFRLKQANYTYF